MIGQSEHFRRAPLAGPRGMHHGLAQLDLLVRMLDQVGLIDDINQVVRFGDSPP